MMLKKGVNPIGLRCEMLLALTVCNEVYKKYKKIMVITSLNDSTHSRKSLHYSGCAADLRTNYFDRSTQLLVVKDIKTRLSWSPHYDVVLESDHIHIEYQPVKD